MPNGINKPQFVITALEVVIPQQGIIHNKPLEFKGTIQRLQGKITTTRLSVDFITTYNGKPVAIATDVAGIIKDDNTFSGTVNQLCFNDAYLNDTNKAPDAYFTLHLCAHHPDAEKEFTSEKINISMATPVKIYTFPLPRQYQEKGYHSGMRSFGSSRSGGRAHAGCDLYAPLEEYVFAVADGVILNYYNFYWKTFALEIDHGDCIVRYGEVQPPADPEKYGIEITKEVQNYIEKLKTKEKNGLAEGLKIGSSVKKGQHIAYIGQLYVEMGNKPYEHTMLHFELYSKNVSGPLTIVNQDILYSNLSSNQKKLNFMRRSDLQDPTHFLDTCEAIDDDVVLNSKRRSF